MALREGHGRARRPRRHRRVPLLRRPGPRRGVAGAAARAQTGALPPDVRDVRRLRALREDADRARTASRPPSCAPRDRPVPLDFEYRETPLHETVAESPRDRTRAHLPRQLHAARLRRGGAEPDERRLSCPKERRRRIAEELGAACASTAPTARTCSAAAPRHRPAPRRPASEVPAARREARPEGPPQGHLRHRHARRRREHPHPHRALHQALQVRRREDRPPQASATSSRSAGAPGARASTTRGAWSRRRPSTSSRTCGSSRRPAGDPAKKQAHRAQKAAGQGLRPLGPLDLPSPHDLAAGAARVALPGHATG